MSLYNMIHGVNPTAPILLMMAGFNPKALEEIKDFLRFRDCYGSKDGTEIIVYTRIGGPNRHTRAKAVELLRSNPNYVRDEDDDFDNTFASFYYRPASTLMLEVLHNMHLAGEDGSDRPAKARQLLEDMQEGRDTPAVQAAMEALKPMAEGMKSMLEGGKSSVSVETIEGFGVDIVGLGPDGELVRPVREEAPRESPDDVA